MADKADTPDVGQEIVLLDNQMVENILLGKVDAPVAFVDPVAATRSITARILAAKGEEALDLPGPLHARDILGRAFVLRAVSFAPGRFRDEEGNLGIYGLLQASWPDSGEEIVITCGANDVMAKAFVLQRDSALPMNVQLVAGNETAAGFRPTLLERA